MASPKRVHPTRLACCWHCSWPFRSEYLKTSGPGYPKSFDEVVARSNDTATHYRSPEKAYALEYTASKALTLDDPSYLAVKNEALAAVKAAIDRAFTKYRLDAMVYPTMPMTADPIVYEPDSQRGSSWIGSPTTLANGTGYPDLIVPAGMTKDGLPVTISFFGPVWSEPKLLGYGYDFEPATHAISLPKYAPALANDIPAY